MFQQNPGCWSAFKLLLFPSEGLDWCLSSRGQNRRNSFGQRKGSTNGLNTAAAQVYISIGYYFNQIYVGLVLEIRRFPLVLCKQRSPSTQSAHVNFGEERKCLPCCNIRSPKPPPTRMSNCLRLCGPALNRIIESNVHFKQRFVT